MLDLLQSEKFGKGPSDGTKGMKCSKLGENLVRPVHSGLSLCSFLFGDRDDPFV